MTTNEIRVLELQEKHGRISQALVCMKLKVTPETGHYLFDYACKKRGRDFFLFRGFGMFEDEFMKGEFLNEIN